MKTNGGGCATRSIIALLLSACAQSQAAIPSPEKLLPDDTLLMVTVPDFAKMREIFKVSPFIQLWNDPAMKPFREKFVSKWKEEFLKPLERELDIDAEDYSSLPQGQVTFAVIQNGGADNKAPTPGILLLIDTAHQSQQLKTNLAGLRQKWVEADKSLRTENIRNFEFFVLTTSGEDTPQTVRKFFPPAPQLQQLDTEGEHRKGSRSELVIGQVDSMLIIGNTTRVVEKIVARLTGGSAPSLGELAAYDANHQALFREAPLYGWINVKAFVDLMTRASSETKEAEAPDPFGNVEPARLIMAAGFASVRTIAFNFQNSNEGFLFKLFLGVPENERQGIFKIMAGQFKESAPPPFVPAEAMKFQRWRIDGQRTWATLQKVFSDISPQWGGAMNFLLDAANATAKSKDPGFDVRENLIGNLGDDLISYEKPPRGTSLAALSSSPSLWLIGSPNPGPLAAALKSILVFMNQGVTPTEREFLGHKVFSVPLPAVPLPIPTASTPARPRTLNCAASSGYVALSTDVSLLEEYLRSNESQTKTLRETAGLTEAAEKVNGPGTALFGYENKVESMRATFERLKKYPNSATNLASSLPAALGMPNPQAAFRDWMDFSLLPSFDKLSKYFHFTVYGGSVSAQGLTLKFFAPTPPQLRGATEQ